MYQGTFYINSIPEFVRKNIYIYLRPISNNFQSICLLLLEQIKLIDKISHNLILNNQIKKKITYFESNIGHLVSIHLKSIHVNNIFLFILMILNKTFSIIFVFNFKQISKFCKIFLDIFFSEFKVLVRIH